MAQGVRKLVAVAGIGGEVHLLEQLFGELSERGADAVAVVGDLGAPWSKADTYRAVFRALGEGKRPTFWWEVEYRLKVIREFDAPETVFLFTTPPAHKGLREPGSEVLAQLIKTYNPRLAIVGGEEPAEEELGRTLVVCPGRLDHGRYAVVDLQTRSVEAASLAQQAAVVSVGTSKR
jgi:hypothetical protein